MCAEAMESGKIPIDTPGIRRLAQVWFLMFTNAVTQKQQEGRRLEAKEPLEASEKAVLS